MVKIWICGCGEKFPTYQKYDKHRKRFHPRASCFFIGDTEDKKTTGRERLHVSLRIGRREGV